MHMQACWCSELSFLISELDSLQVFLCWKVFTMHFQCGKEGLESSGVVVVTMFEKDDPMLRM